MGPEARIALAFLLALAAVPTIQADPANGDFTFAPPGSIDGNLRVRGVGPAYAAFYAIQTAGNASFQFHGDSLRFELMHWSQDYVETRPGDEQPIPGSEKTASETIDFGPSSLYLQGLRANSTHVFRSARDFDEAWASSVVVERPLFDPYLTLSSLAAKGSLEPFPRSPEWPNRYDIVVPGANHHVRPTTYAITHHGSSWAYWGGVELLVRNATGSHRIEADQWWERAPADPTGVLQPLVRKHVTAIVANQNGTSQLSYGGAHGHLLAPEMALENVTHLSMPLAEGNVKVGSQTLEYENGSFLDVAGLFAVRFGVLSDNGETERAGFIRAQLLGEVTSIRENRVSTTSFVSTPLVVATAGASLLVLVLYAVVSWARRGAVYVWSKTLFLKWFTIAPFAARLAPEAVLEHPTRKAILDMLREHPFIQLKTFRLAAATKLGISSFTVYKHLRVLRAHQHLDVIQPPSQAHLFIAPNHGLIKERRIQVAAALLHQPIGLMVAQTLLEMPGATQKAVIAAVQERLQNDPRWIGARTISNIGVLKWLKKFESYTIAPRNTSTAFGIPNRAHEDSGDADEVALVRREREGRLVRYWPTELLGTVVRAFMERSPDLGRALSEIGKKPPSPSDELHLSDPSIA